MKAQLIMLPQPILVSDENIKAGDYFFDTETGRGILLCEKSSEHFITSMNSDISFPHDFCKKIIAGIPERYSITYSDEVSKTLQERCGWVDEYKLAEKLLTTHPDFKAEGMSEYQNGRYNGILEGFKTAQSLNEKRFSEDEVEQMIRRYSELLLKAIEADENPTPESLPLPLDFIKSLSQPKVFDVIIEETRVSVDSTTNNRIFDKHIPVITNNSIKVIKVL